MSGPEAEKRERLRWYVLRHLAQECESFAARIEGLRDSEFDCPGLHLSEQETQGRDGRILRQVDYIAELCSAVKSLWAEQNAKLEAPPKEGAAVV